MGERGDVENFALTDL